MGDIEVEHRAVEIVVTQPPVHLSGIAVAVANGDVVKLNQARHDVHRIRCCIIDIGVVDLKLQIVGKDVAVEVDVVEIAIQARLARHLALDVRSDCRHKRLQEAELGLVGIEIDAQRVARRIYGTGYHRAQAIVLVDIGMQIDCFGVVVPVAAYQRIAHHTFVVGNAVDLQTRRFEHRCARQQSRGKEFAGGYAAKHHVVDAKCFKHIVETHLLQVNHQHIRLIFRH